MIAFLQSLFESGNVVLDDSRGDCDSEADVHRLLSDCERIARQNLPNGMPSFSPVAGRQAACLFHSLCHAVIDRQMEVAGLEQQILQLAEQFSRNAEAHYSVDLVLRYLPELADRARRISPSDPLLELILLAGGFWPLSSVGMSNLHVPTIPDALRHPALWKMYVDRIILRQDVSRVDQPDIRNSVRAALGMYGELAPAIAAAVGSTESSSSNHSPSE
ncbi:MAG: hypothetical protein KDA96_06565 [Planctomycetaceae bacterium]|nr:hypothetical protein [Planctomycetaceae bacterium]